MKEPKFKHYFTVKEGKFIFEEKDMFEFKRKDLEGRRGYAIIERVGDQVTVNQWAYYFGGIIRKECMVSNIFQGLSEMQIHQVLFFDIRSSVKGILMPDGTTRLVTVTEDFSSYGKEEMRKYIEEVIAHLQVEYDIHPKPAESYKYNRFHLKEKLVK
jgi:hypothetical protein